MRTIETPKWLSRRWADVKKAADEISGWAEVYSSGYIGAIECASDMPGSCPAELPLYGNGVDEWPDFESKDLYASFRTFDGFDLAGEFLEAHFGTFAVFRVPTHLQEALSAGYDEAGTENERIISDGDHDIVVYML